MQELKFLKLSLLSQREQRGLQIDFSSEQTVLVAGNGYGKSAIIKSLYEALGAKPHKVDETWRGAKVSTLLEFAIDGHKYAALKMGDNFTIFDQKIEQKISTNRVVSELAPFIANLLDFRLVLSNDKDQARIPPPSYAFAPFYIDQDRSWQKPWSSFQDLTMFQRSAKDLSEYHSGSRPNQYYQAKAGRDKAKRDLEELSAERGAVHQALVKVREEMPNVPLALDMASFNKEIDRLVSEGKSLHEEQSKYRNEIVKLNEEYYLWQDHVKLVEFSLREIDDAFNQAVGHPPDVECPMCGHHYSNDIISQFALKADSDELVTALQTGRSHLKELEAKISAQKNKLDGVLRKINIIQEILAIKKEDISLQDIVQAEGRNEAQRILQLRLENLDANYATKQRIVDVCEQNMKEADSKTRKDEIRDYFHMRMSQCAQSLDVSLPDSRSGALQGSQIGRGSVSTRALAAYYYAFLHTAHKYGSSTFSPIVVDAPNQQGQDQGHLKMIMEFLLSQMPTGAQVIIGAETLGSVTPPEVIDVSHKKNQVLREDSYESTADYMRPYFSQLLL